MQISLLNCQLSYSLLPVGQRFFGAAEHVIDPKKVKLSINAELFLKLPHHCAKHKSISHRNGAR